MNRRQWYSSAVTPLVGIWRGQDGHVSSKSAGSASRAHEEHLSKFVGTRRSYCDATCQHDHWRRGHKQICKKIHRGGNAEQYYADKKYKEAVAAAVEECAEDIEILRNTERGT